MAAAVQTQSRRAGFSRQFGLPRKYAVSLLGAIVLEISLLMFLIEGIFLAEKLSGILEQGIAAKMGFANVVLLLLSTAPEIFDLALPSALLLAVYRVVLRLREDSELIIMAGIGIGAHRLIALLAVLAVPAQLLTVAMSGFVEPQLRFLQRAITFDSAYGTLRNESAAGEFHFPGDYTVFVQPRSADDTRRPLLLHQPVGPRTDRLVSAGYARLVEERDGWFALHLRNFVVYDFFPARSLADLTAPPVAADATVQMSVVRVGSFEQELALDRLIYFGPREAPPELTLPELLHRGASTEFAQRLLRSLLCLFAPLIALLAVALTRRASRAFTLPLAALILMGIDVANSALLGRATSISLATGVAAAVAALLVLLALYHQALARQDGLLKAVLGKV
jgi:lipopolysaccharide export system permease protein